MIMIEQVSGIIVLQKLKTTFQIYKIHSMKDRLRLLIQKNERYILDLRSQNPDLEKNEWFVNILSDIKYFKDLLNALEEDEIELPDKFYSDIEKLCDILEKSSKNQELTHNESHFLMDVLEEYKTNERYRSMLN